jgi:hypothetical protein
VSKGGDTRAQAAANGNKVGRPQKQKVEQTASPEVATEVLAMDGPPDHRRKCKCEVCADHRKRRCKCNAPKEGEKPDERCKTFTEHRICHCEICGWWEGLDAPDKRLRIDTRKYLADRSRGKAIQPVTHEDTKPREIIVTVRRIGA